MPTPSHPTATALPTVASPPIHSGIALTLGAVVLAVTKRLAGFVVAGMVGWGVGWAIHAVRLWWITSRIEIDPRWQRVIDSVLENLF